jgi:hypothetical protein
MNPAHENFKACIENLEKLNTEYIQVNRAVLETSAPTQVPVTSSILSSSSAQATPTMGTIVINDYVRMCRINCIMLWTYWDALRESISLPKTLLEELRLVRNCLVHHEGDMARYSQSLNPQWAADGTKLISITTGKSYVQGYSLVIAEADLAYFTNLVKAEFTNQTGVAF